MVTDEVSDEKVMFIGLLKSDRTLISYTQLVTFPHLLQCHSQVLLLLESHKVQPAKL